MLTQVQHRPTHLQASHSPVLLQLQAAIPFRACHWSQLQPAQRCVSLSDAPASCHCSCVQRLRPECAFLGGGSACRPTLCTSIHGSHSCRWRLRPASLPVMPLVMMQRAKRRGRRAAPRMALHQAVVARCVCVLGAGDGGGGERTACAALFMPHTCRKARRPTLCHITCLRPYPDTGTLRQRCGRGRSRRSCWQQQGSGRCHRWRC